MLRKVPRDCDFFGWFDVWRPLCSTGENFCEPTYFSLSLSLHSQFSVQCTTLQPDNLHSTIDATWYVQF